MPGCHLDAWFKVAHQLYLFLQISLVDRTIVLDICISHTCWLYITFICTSFTKHLHLIHVCLKYSFLTYVVLVSFNI